MIRSLSLQRLWREIGARARHPATRALRGLCLSAGLWSTLAMAVEAPAIRPLIEPELRTVDGAHQLVWRHHEPVLLNFMHSDCAPCREELPLLMRSVTQEPGWQLVVIAIDQRRSVERLIDKLGLKPVASAQWALAGNDYARGLMRRLGNPSGALPFSVMLDRDHRLCATHMGALNEHQIRDLVQRRCGPTSSIRPDNTTPDQAQGH